MNAEDDMWDDTTEVRRKTRPLKVDSRALHALERLARAPSARDARGRAALLRDALGAQADAFDAVVDALVARADELERTRRLAARDELTGIANRRSFNEALERELSRARRGRRRTSVLLFDLDGLKVINDTLGHAAGDEALRTAAGRAEELVRNGDVVARIGGDEFAVLLPDTARGEARAIGERLREELSALRVHISLGVAESRGRTTGSVDLLARADAELYRDKVERKSLRPPAG
ncbi:MAG: GGDEF domain-containing protein [Myxococcales bacterium]